MVRSNTTNKVQVKIITKNTLYSSESHACISRWIFLGPMKFGLDIAGPDHTFYIKHKTFYFGITVDSHVVVKNNAQRVLVSSTQFPLMATSCRTLSTLWHQDTDINLVKL